MKRTQWNAKQQGRSFIFSLLSISRKRRSVLLLKPHQVESVRLLAIRKEDLRLATNNLVRSLREGDCRWNLKRSNSLRRWSVYGQDAQLGQPGLVLAARCANSVKQQCSYVRS